MAHDIRPTQPDDLPALSRFLADGFHAPPDAPFAAPDVLHWKYIDPRGEGEPVGPRSYIALDGPRIVGHVGVCLGAFRGPGLPEQGVSTLHMIDWLSTQRGSSVGAYLMLRAHRTTATQYGFGGSQAGRSVIEGGGYDLLGRVPVYQKVLRPGYRLRAPETRGPKTLARWARDLFRMTFQAGRSARRTVTLDPVESFGPEVDPILEHYQTRAVFTSREAGLLNHLLRYPRGGISGWHLRLDGRLAGFALLSLVRHGQTSTGKVVDCVLDDPDPDAWHGAVFALTQTLKRLGADVAQGFAGTDWTARAFQSCGYHPLHHLEFRLRDKDRLVPRDAPFHLTPLEADYAYT